MSKKSGIRWYWHIVLFFITGGLWIFYPLVRAIVKMSRVHNVKAVQVAFRDLTAPAPTGTGGAYTYSWPLKETPYVGMRVIVPDNSTAVIVALGVGASARGMQLVPVTRAVTQQEIAAAHAKELQNQQRLIEQARKRIAGYGPRTFTTVPPLAGDVDPATADHYGRQWWKIYKTAEEIGADASDISAFKSIAHRWFAIRDRQLSPTVRSASGDAPETPATQA